MSKKNGVKRPSPITPFSNYLQKLSLKKALQSFCLVRHFPRETVFRTLSKVPVSCSLTKYRSQQFERFNTGAGFAGKMLAGPPTILSSDTLPVPNVSTMMETGSATPMA